MNQLIAMNAEITMSSREIADLVEARHNDVVSTIDRLFDKGLLRSSRKTRREATGGRPIEVYDLNERDTHLVVAGYSDEHRAKVIDRWQELETKAKPSFMRSLSQEAIIMLEDLDRQLRKSQQQLAIAAPKAEFVDRYMSAPETFGFRQVAKKLHMKENELRDFLLDNRVMYYLSGRLTAYANHVDAGRFEQVSGVAGNDHAYTQSKFTTKGVEWLAGEIAKSKLK